MKKFLSLVLSLVMAMSLVTVSAGAKDDEGFTDASDINYKEAVDVMSGIGIISGYRDDSFRPDGALTRGAAAKIIAYLNLGTKTADVLSCTSAPYKDVKPTDTFAPYIAYVKNAEICDGYSDGTFRAGAALTGFAFNKMLLTSLGYNSETEGFTGANWSVAVAKRAVKIGLTDGNDDFTGMGTCTREEACLYALNTLQANEVEYDNEGSIVTAGDVKIVNKASKAEDVTIGSNDKRYRNIDNEKSDGDQIVQFAEDHFKDLKLDEDKSDDFGAPANKWTYKDKEIGTYATEADFEFTTIADGDTVEDKIEDTGLDEYTLENNSVTPVINGKDDTKMKLVVKKGDELGDDTSSDSAAKIFTKDLLGKGRLVKVYTDDQTITDVVVIDTYLAQIDSISSSADRVTLKTKEEDSQTFKVDDDNDCYAELADMDEDDYVLVTAADKDVKSVAIPETETGTISRISKSDGKCDGLTFDGTKYKLSATANNKKDGDAFSTSMELKADYDSTLYIDTYGYAIWIDDVEADSDYMVAIETYSAVEDGKIVTYVQGYDMEGNEVSLNIGTNAKEAVDTNNNDNGDHAIDPGTVYAYSTEDAANNGDYLLSTDARIQHKTEGFKASAVKYDKHYFDDDVKFLFIEEGNDMDDVTVETECQEVTIPKDTKDSEKYIQYVLDDTDEFDDKEIIAVVIKAESDNATGDDVAYVDSVDAKTDVDGDKAKEYTLYIEGDEVEGVVSKDIDISEHTFVTYAKNDDGTYELDTYKPADHYNDDTAVILGAIVKAVPTEKIMTLTEKVGNYFNDATELTDLNCKNAEVIDLTKEDEIGNMSDLQDAVKDEDIDDIKVSVVFNNKDGDDDEHMVSYIFVTDADYDHSSSGSGSHHDDNDDVESTATYEVNGYNATYARFDLKNENGDDVKLFVKKDFEGFKFADDNNKVAVSEDAMLEWLATNAGDDFADDYGTIAVEDDILVITVKSDTSAADEAEDAIQAIVDAEADKVETAQTVDYGIDSTAKQAAEVKAAVEDAVDTDNVKVAVTTTAEGKYKVTLTSTENKDVTNDTKVVTVTELGAVSGKVTDADGKAIQGATVKIDKLIATTSDEGTYLIENVPAKSVSVTVTADGYQKKTVTVPVTAGVEAEDTDVELTAATTPKLTKTGSAATAGSKDIVVKLTENLDLDTGDTLEGFTVKVNDASVDVKTVKYTDDSKITITLEEAAIDLDATMFVKVIYDGSDETAVNADGVALEDGYIQFSVSAAAEG